MKKIAIGLFFLCLCGGLIISVLPSRPPSPGHPPTAPAAASVPAVSLPLCFIQNAGQVDPAVRYYARSAGYTLWLTGAELVFDMAAGAQAPQPGVRRDIVRLRFPGANPAPAIAAVAATPLRVNFFRGDDRRRWRSGVPTATSVAYRELYRGIDLLLREHQCSVEYDWEVRPGGDPAAIRLAFSGAGRTRLDPGGDLLVECSAGRLRHRRPVAYQVIAGRRRPVAASFRRLAAGRFGISVARYDRRRTLVIDPLVLAYSSYLGGSGNEYGLAIGGDGSGRIVVAGNTFSTDFPTANAVQTAQGDQDVFVARLETGGSAPLALSYATYLGGNDQENCGGLAVDGAGAIYVAGNTLSRNFPARSPVQDHQAGSDAFLVKLDPARAGADSLVFSSCLGGNGNDLAFAVAVAGSGTVGLAGYTTSADFPARNPLQGYQGGMDLFVATFDLTRSGADALTFSSCYGGKSDDRAAALAIDGQGALYVAGSSRSADFPTHAPFAAPRGSWDAVLLKIDPSRGGSDSLLYSTCLGGSGADYGNGLAVDGDGNAHLTGSTDSADFPLRNGFQEPRGLADAFVAKLAPGRGGAESLLYATCLGGADWDFGTGIVVDSRGLAYVTGYTASADFPWRYGWQSFQGGWDAFVARLNPAMSGSGSLCNSSCLGGKGADYGRAIVRDSQGLVHVAGYTLSSDFPQERTALKPGGRLDVFVSGLRVVDPVSLGLQTTRKLERSWLLQREYGEIEVTVDNPQNVPLATLQLFRSEAGGEFVLLEQVPGTQLQAGRHTTIDRDIVAGTGYVYRAMALDADGVMLALTADVAL